MSTTLKMANGDLFISKITGKSQTITGPEKCSQDLGEVLLTLLVPEKVSRSYTNFPRAYGSELPYIRAPIQFSGFIGRPLISKKIEEAVGRLQQSQKQDPQSTSDERIKEISQLLVDQQNTTDFLFFLEVLLEGGTTLQVQNLTPTALDHLVMRGSYTDDRIPARLT